MTEQTTTKIENNNTMNDNKNILGKNYVPQKSMMELRKKWILQFKEKCNR